MATTHNTITQQVTKRSLPSVQLLFDEASGQYIPKRFAREIEREDSGRVGIRRSFEPMAPAIVMIRLYFTAYALTCAALLVYWLVRQCF